MWASGKCLLAEEQMNIDTEPFPEVIPGPPPSPPLLLLSSSSTLHWSLPSSRVLSESVRSTANTKVAFVTS